MRRNVEVVAFVVSMKRSLSTDFDSHKRLLILGHIVLRRSQPIRIIVVVVAAILILVFDVVVFRRLRFLDLDSPVRSVPVHFGSVKASRSLNGSAYALLSCLLLFLGKREMMIVAHVSHVSFFGPAGLYLSRVLGHPFWYSESGPFNLFGFTLRVVSALTAHWFDGSLFFNNRMTKD